MGTMGKTEEGVKQGQAGQAGMQGGQVGSPISNEAYNVLTALQAKLEGLEAYRKYQKDGPVQLWQQLAQFEMQAVGVLINQLEQLVKDGKFRAQIPQSKPMA